MNIKKQLLILTFSGAFLGAMAQNYSGNPGIDPKEVQSLKTNMLLVVVDSAESNLGKAIENAFTKYWKFTKFKFIKSSEIEKNMNNPKISIFNFTLVGGFQKGHEFVSNGFGNGLIFDQAGSKQLFILIGDNMVPGKTYYKNRVIAASAKCYFAIFTGSPDIKKIDEGLYSGVNIAK